MIKVMLEDVMEVVVVEMEAAEMLVKVVALEVVGQVGEN